MTVTKYKLAPLRDTADILATNVYQKLFPPHLELAPKLNEVYELELAFYESNVLSGEEIFRNGAYFARVGDMLTRHFLMCSGEPVRLPQHSSSRHIRKWRVSISPTRAKYA